MIAPFGVDAGSKPRLLFFREKKMKNWHLLIEHGFFGEDHFLLVCKDVGEITSFSMNYYLPEDHLLKVPYVSGIVVADGKKVPIRQNLTAVICDQGIMHGGSWKKLLDMLPDQIPVIHDHVRRGLIQDESETIRKSELKKTYYHDQGYSNYVIADPRINWMSLFVLGNDPWLTARMSIDIPTMEEAITNLEEYGLSHPYCRGNNNGPDDLWGMMNRIWGDFTHRYQEENSGETELPSAVVRAAKLAEITKLEMERRDLRIELKDVRGFIQSDIETNDEDGELENDRRREAEIVDRLAVIKKELKRRRNAIRQRNKPEISE